jgi:hypothetical protein
MTQYGIKKITKAVTALAAAFLITGTAFAGMPVLTFQPLTATTIDVPYNDTVTIQYKVTNQSRTTHTLAMTPTPGITQTTTPGNCSSPFTLSYQQSCTLTLEVDGAALQGNIIAGPKVCKQGSDLLCYQPSAADIIRVTLSSIPGATTLSTSVSDLALSINATGTSAALTGSPRTFTITNTGSGPAINIMVTYPTWPTDTTAVSTCTDTLEAGASCDITVTPGATATSDGVGLCTEGTVPVADVVSVAGSNTNTVNTNVLVLGYGCQYQGGFLFSVDDTTPDTGSIGGKVVTLTSLENQNWVYIKGTEINGADDFFDGAQNTADILEDDSCTGWPTYCAAWQCNELTVDGFSDWYLPAICEMGGPGGAVDCSGNPTQQNIQQNLVSTPAVPGVGLSAVQVWSSTEYIDDPANLAYRIQFLSSDGNIGTWEKGIPDGNLDVRCVRAL